MPKIVLPPDYLLLGPQEIATPSLSSSTHYHPRVEVVPFRGFGVPPILCHPLQVLGQVKMWLEPMSYNPSEVLAMVPVCLSMMYLKLSSFQPLEF